jgi:Cdc6-like AAA superfamily ATPase
MSEQKTQNNFQIDILRRSIEKAEKNQKEIARNLLKWNKELEEMLKLPPEPEWDDDDVWGSYHV